MLISVLIKLSSPPLNRTLKLVNAVEHSDPMLGRDVRCAERYCPPMRRRHGSK